MHVLHSDFFNSCFVMYHIYAKQLLLTLEKAYFLQIRFRWISIFPRIHPFQEKHYAGADPEGGFGDLSPLNFLEVKII